MGRFPALVLVELLVQSFVRVLVGMDNSFSPRPTETTACNVVNIALSPVTLLSLLALIAEGVLLLTVVGKEHRDGVAIH